jgi:hypothetical protein
MGSGSPTISSTTTPPSTEKKHTYPTTDNSNIPSGAPIVDISKPPAKESLPPSAPSTPGKQQKKYYRLLVPILGAVVAAIIVLVLVTSSMQHPSGPSTSVQPAPTGAANMSTTTTPTLRTVNAYSFIKKWGSKGVADGQFVNPLGVAVDSSGNVYVVDNGNNHVQVFTQYNDTEGSNKFNNTPPIAENVSVTTTALTP